MSRGRGEMLLVLVLVWSLIAIGCDPSHSQNRMRDASTSLENRAGPPNVVVVVLDAARADHFGLYGYERDTTPTIDDFAKGATRYDVVLSEAPYTFLSTSSLFAGASPAETGLGARTGGRVPESMELIAETARDAGYRTFGYSENPYVTRYFGMAQGFDVFGEVYPTSNLRTGRELPENIDSAARMKSMIEAATGATDEPFFFYTHLLRPHNPYAPPAPYAGRFGSEPGHRTEGTTQALVALDRAKRPLDTAQIDRVIALYDENLAFADSLFAGLLSNLEEAGVLENTVIVLTADHGEGFGEHGRLLHSTQLFDPMLRVPLVVRIPDGVGGVQSTPIQLADLGAALRSGFETGEFAGMETLGRERPPRAPLYSWTNAQTHHMAARTPTRRLVLDMVSQDVVAYHALTQAGDTEIAMDAEGEAMRVDLLARLADWTGALPDVAAPPELDPVKRRQLESLGYLQN